MIYTFYSFKGGVGRSMALASVAYLLACRGLRVLAVDFDLEAPGLERYFFNEDEARRVRRELGLIDLLGDYKSALSSPEEFAAARFRDWRRYIQPAVLSADETGRGCVDLMSAGCREPSERFKDYALTIRSFDWQNFIEQWKGDQFFRWLRDELVRTDHTHAYDAVLVDSRTGLTEMGGVCAYQLADAAVMLCAPNEQNLEGTLRVALDFRSPGTMALRQGRELPLLVIPARLDAQNERRAEFLEKFEAKFPRTEFLPREVFLAGYDYATLALPYDPEFAIIEQLVGESRKHSGAVPTHEVFGRLADAVALMSTRPGRLRDLCNTPSAPPVDRRDDPTKRSSGFDIFLDDAALPEPGLRRALRSALSSYGLRVSGALDELLPGVDLAEAVGAQVAASLGVVTLTWRGRDPTRWSSVDLTAARLRGQPRLTVDVDLDPVTSDPPRWQQVDGGGEALAGLVSAYEYIGRDIHELAYWLSRAWDESSGASRARRRLAESPAAPECPYPGLRAFREAEAALFFGRDDIIASWTPQILGHRLTVIQGAAGVGKTSLLCAGLIPALRKAVSAEAGVNLTVRTFEGSDLPVARPYRGTPSEHELWVVDHLETASSPGEEVAHARIAAIPEWLAAAGRAPRWLVVVMRRTWPPALLASAFNRWSTAGDGSVSLLELRVEPLGEAQLSEVIERPPGRLGHVAEPGAATVLATQAMGLPGSIAQLAAVLPRFWDGRRRGWLTCDVWPNAAAALGAWAAEGKSLMSGERPKR